MSKDKRLGADVDEFVGLLVGLQAVEVCGLAKVLGVKIMLEKGESDDDKKSARDVNEILEDIVVNFAALARQRRREIVRIMRPTVKYNKKAKLTPLQVEQQNAKEVNLSGTATKD